jgi:hypothetical protein
MTNTTSKSNPLMKYILSKFNPSVLPTAEVDPDSIRYIDNEKTIRELLQVVQDQNYEIIARLDSIYMKKRNSKRKKKGSKKK